MKHWWRPERAGHGSSTQTSYELVPHAPVSCPVPGLARAGSATSTAGLRLVSVRPASSEPAVSPGPPQPPDLLGPCRVALSGSGNPGRQRHLLVLDRLACSVRPLAEPALMPSMTRPGQARRARSTWLAWLSVSRSQCRSFPNSPFPLALVTRAAGCQNVGVIPPPVPPR
jgi:hypothetical protein